MEIHTQWRERQKAEIHHLRHVLKQTFGRHRQAMSANGKMFRVTKWLPGMYVEGDERFSLDADLTGWILHFAERGIKVEIRHRASDGRISLWREGTDAFPSDGQD